MSCGESLGVATSGSVWGEVGCRQILCSRISVQMLVQAFRRGGCVHTCEVPAGLPQPRGQASAVPASRGRSRRTVLAPPRLGEGFTQRCRGQSWMVRRR